MGSRYESLVLDVIPAGCERALDVPSKPRRRSSIWFVAAPTTWKASLRRRLATELLPGARRRRHLMWRFSLVWVNEGRPR